jgi:hypothetical protein
MIAYMEMAIKANGVHNKAVSTTVFESLEAMFKKWDANVVAALSAKEADIVDRVGTLLYQRQYDSFGLVFKMQRVKAVAALMEVPWKSAIVEILGSRLDEEITLEPADPVREELKKAQRKLQQL